MPLEQLLKVMRDPSAPLERRMYCAIAAAPYCHAKLKAIVHAGQEGRPIEQKIVLAFD
jgi:hypothetical protein